MSQRPLVYTLTVEFPTPKDSMDELRRRRTISEVYRSCGGELVSAYEPSETKMVYMLDFPNHHHAKQALQDLKILGGKAVAKR